MNQIREEFEKAFDAQIIEATKRDRIITKAAALWAAKWIAKRICKQIDIFAIEDGYSDGYGAGDVAKEIRQLAKDLES